MAESCPLSCNLAVEEEPDAKNEENAAKLEEKNGKQPVNEGAKDAAKLVK